MKTSKMKVSDIGEKQLIERIIEKSKSCSINSLSNFNDLKEFNASNNYDGNDFKTSFKDFKNNYGSNDFKTSIGDDSALTNIDIDENSYLVSSTDMLIQSSHFPYGMTYFQMGYKSVVVNVSDLASMGADNIAFLLNIAIPKDMLLDDFDEMICGVISACDNYNISLIGGDTNQSREIILSGTAIGQVDKDKALMKYGFKPGDLVCISGELGLAALGFELLNIRKMLENNLFEMVDLEEKLQKAYEIDSSLCEMAIFKALRPEAKYNEGHILREYNTKDNRVSATDITDGLASEFYEILNSDKKYCYQNSLNDSNNIDFNSYSKGIRIYEDKLPIEDEYKQIANVLGLDYLDLFLHIGEDFELLFTINNEIINQLSDEMNFYVIGEIVDRDMIDISTEIVDRDMIDISTEIVEKNTVEIVLSNGEIKNISSSGYEHLK